MMPACCVQSREATGAVDVSHRMRHMGLYGQNHTVLARPWCRLMPRVSVSQRETSDCPPLLTGRSSPVSYVDVKEVLLAHRLSFLWTQNSHQQDR